MFSDLVEQIQEVEGTVEPDAQVRLVRGLGGTPTSAYVRGTTYVSEADLDEEGDGGIFCIIAGDERGYIISGDAEAIEEGIAPEPPMPLAPPLPMSPRR